MLEPGKGKDHSETSRVDDHELEGWKPMAELARLLIMSVPVDQKTEVEPEEVETKVEPEEWRITATLQSHRTKEELEVLRGEGAGGSEVQGGAEGLTSHIGAAGSEGQGRVMCSESRGGAVRSFWQKSMMEWAGQESRRWSTRMRRRQSLYHQCQ